MLKCHTTYEENNEERQQVLNKAHLCSQESPSVTYLEQCLFLHSDVMLTL